MGHARTRARAYDKVYDSNYDVAGYEGRVLITPDHFKAEATAHDNHDLANVHSVSSTVAELRTREELDRPLAP